MSDSGKFFLASHLESNKSSDHQDESMKGGEGGEDEQQEEVEEEAEVKADEPPAYEYKVTGVALAMQQMKDINLDLNSLGREIDTLYQRHAPRIEEPPSRPPMI